MLSFWVFKSKAKIESPRVLYKRKIISPIENSRPPKHRENNAKIKSVFPPLKLAK